MAAFRNHPNVNLVLMGILIAGFVTASQAVDFAGGTGESNDPYQIATAEQLIAISSDPNLFDKHFILTADIDLDPSLPGGRAFLQAVIAPGQPSWGRFLDVPFTGGFDGNGHRIMNLVFQGEDPFLGLFGEIGKGGMVRDLRLEGVRFENAVAPNGSPLASSNRGTILRCRTAGFVCGRGRLGGLVSLNNGLVNSCRSDCSVHGTMRDGLIGGTTLGGLIGYNESGMVLDCYATGNVSGVCEYAGGLVGDNCGGVVSRCYARGAVSVTETGGYCYVGGFSGETSNIWSPRGPGSVRHCFWDTDATGQILSSGGFGRTTAEMILAATFVGWGPEWTIKEGLDYPSLAWEQAGGTPLRNHPSRTYDGKGGLNEPFVLRDANDLRCLMARSEDWSSAFEIADDIDMRGVPFLPLADFSGVLDGRGNKIINLTIHEDSVLLGLIGSLEGGAVRDLCLSDVDIQGVGLVGALAALNHTGCITNCTMTGRIVGTVVVNNGYEHCGSVGGLVGINYQGYLGRCLATPSIISEGRNGVGGLVAFNYYGCVTCSRSAAEISVDEMMEHAGGFAAHNGGSITNCYSGGSITRRSSVVDGRWCSYTRCLAGFVASNWGSIVHCYASARVSPGDLNCTVVGGFLADTLEGGYEWDCFWDMEVTGAKMGITGIGLTTEQMRKRGSFVGWDFENVWTICEGADYPRLRWENVNCEVGP